MPLPSNQTLVNQPDFTTKKLTEYWYRLLSKKQYSESELIQKAKKRTYSEEDIIRALTILKDQRFINDSIVATGVSFQYQGRKGRRFLETKLRQKGINPELIQETSENFEESLSIYEIEKIKRKYMGIEEPYVRKQKVMMYLMGRGYTTISKLLEELGL